MPSLDDVRDELASISATVGQLQDSMTKLLRMMKRMQNKLDDIERRVKQLD